jgi:hypothetical protein
MKYCAEYPNKKRYNTQKDAQTAILTSDAKNLQEYKCDSCLGWHLTSNKKNNTPP